MFTATATAALAELGGQRHPRRTSIVSAVANMGGLGLGTVVAGLFAQYGADPTHLVFWVYLATLVLAFLAVAVTPETVAARRRPVVSVRRPGLPQQHTGRSEFLRAAAAIFAAFAVCGMFSSLVPSFLLDGLHVHNIAGIGASVALLFLVAVVTQVVTPARLRSARWPAPAALITGVGVVETGLWTQSLPTFVIGTILAGTGVGLTFRRGIGISQRLAEPGRRADLLATYFLAAYTGTIVPTLALGLLDEALHHDLATLLLAVAVVATTLAAALNRPTHGSSRHTGESL